ncbi:uracil-DNA glycosylase family protein [Novosphingobium sp. Leaf2]|uniref:uracil-DNA glycosylase family protein n=1 Tax=Novosphingobium sp. Leaf2 TaxID=1735670 RepID=UPI0006FDB14F|nr:uracil-DNA glycosylase family protein [Novosphingobium sp. Leaf2]KQM17325.1 hypothetical protein ASE49_09650 [Novosphingobium sp. Leaf2]
MDQRPNTPFLDDVTGALDWWRSAGVDCDYLDEPVTWLASAEPEAAAVPLPSPRTAPADVIPAPAEAKIDPASLPADLAAFTPWWLTEPLLCEGGPAARVAPQGQAGADLMVVVEEPEAGDTETLLAGPHGKLLDAMLTAFGTSRDAIYLASALPRHTPGADWRAMVAKGIGQVLARHIELAAPKRVMILGGNVLPLLGHESPHRPAVLRSLNHEGGSIPMLTAWALPALLAQPRAKPVLWKAWLEWTAD